MDMRLWLGDTEITGGAPYEVKVEAVDRAELQRAWVAKQKREIRRLRWLVARDLVIAAVAFAAAIYCFSRLFA